MTRLVKPCHVLARTRDRRDTLVAIGGVAAVIVAAVIAAVVLASVVRYVFAAVIAAVMICEA